MMSTYKTSVLWDINGCPIPDGFDPRLVGPKIESALKNSGCSGPLTITAIGDLRQTGDKVLRDLSSTGIALLHSYDVGLYSWKFVNPPPATIMLICGLSKLNLHAPKLYNLQQQGYTVLLAYPQRDQPLEWLWRSFLLCVTKEWLWKSLLEDEMDSGTADEATRLVLQYNQYKSPFSCVLCHFGGQNFDDFATHLKSVSHAYYEWDRVASKTKVNRLKNKPVPPNNDPDTIKEWDALYKEDMEGRDYTQDSVVITQDIDKISLPKMEVKTLVLWDINRCPIPDGFDPRLVSQRILSALNNSSVWWLPGPLTIIAIGDLTQIPLDKVLRELSSTRIALIHSESSFSETEIQTRLYEWTRFNPSPATIMLISDPPQLEVLAPTIYHLQVDEYYTFLLAYPQRDQARDWLWKSFLACVSKEWLWKSLLEDVMDSGTADDKKETTRLVLQDNSCEIAESRWSCSVCDCAFQSFEDLAEHIYSHILKTTKRGMLKKKLTPNDCEQDEKERHGPWGVVLL